MGRYLSLSRESDETHVDNVRLKSQRAVAVMRVEADVGPTANSATLFSPAISSERWFFPKLSR